MYIHRVSGRRQTSRRASLPRRVVWSAGLVALVAIVMLSFYVGAVAQRNGRLAGMGKLLARPLHAAYQYGAAHFGSTPAPEHIFIDLKFKHYNKLLEKREQALELGVLLRDKQDFVPAEIRTGTETLPVKLRLKGDLLDHLRRDRWSFRIHVKQGQQFRGMRRFSIQHPRTRGFVWEWAVLEAMRREEILAPRYGFLEVTLNGKPLGLYAFEESFGKELLENQARRESVIVKFNEAWRWEELASSEGRTKRFLLWNNAAIHVFNEQAVREDRGLMKHYEAAVANIEGFRRGDIAACDAFDCERVARFWAVADLMGASHALHWINLRYYYNPITTRLEPIAFDCLGGFRLAHLAGTARLDLDEQRGRDDPMLGFMADPRFATLYVRALQRMSRPEYLLALQEDLADGVNRNLSTLQREWPWEDFDWDVLASNQALIRSFLDPPVALLARFDPASLDTDRIGLRMANLLAFPVEVLGARIGEHELPLADTVLDGKPARGTLDWLDVVLTLPPEAAGPRPAETPLPEVVVWHRLLGDDTIREARAELGSPEIALQGAPRPAPGSVAFAAQHPFLEVDRQNKRVRIQAGRWQVAGDLVVPAGWTLAAGPGTRLAFEEGSVLLSYSPLELVGRVDDPVVLEPQGPSWGGLQVIEAGGPSLVEQVAIRATAAVDRPGWTLTGGVTFYESPVTLVGVSFTEALGEDALNLVRSEFRMTDCLFRDAAFDALDIDFGEGSIESTRFVGPGNDALDVSGSTVVVEDLVVLEAGDKGISAGEASDVRVLSARIEQSNIGIATKDRSRVSVTGAEITGCRIGVAVFQKKPEFGGAFLYLEGSRLQQNETDFLVEVGSILQIDGAAVPADATGVGDALYDR